MIRILSVLIAGFLMCGCAGSKKDTDVIRVSLLRGPSTIAFVEWIVDNQELNGRQLRVEIMDSPDQIQAGLIRRETDIAVLPMISAANLYNKGVPYVLAGCPIWGTLYIVGKPSFSTLHLFGAGTTPDLLTRYYLDRQGKQYELNYAFSTASEIARGLLAGKVEAAVLSEPFVSIVVQRDSSLRILADLNQLTNNSSGFAQTAVVFHPSLLSERSGLDSLIRKTCAFAIEHPARTIQLLEEAGLFAEGMLTEDGLTRNHIYYRPAQEAEADIRAFLRIIEKYEPKAIGGRMPDRGFITGEP